MDFWSLVLYGVLIFAFVTVYLKRQHRMRACSLSAHKDTIAAGMTEPASLHLIIDPSLCLGCGTCVKACPEQPLHEVLGLINSKAVLVGPSDCIGHGACKTGCPFDAITLVFGTERRGLDIPLLKPSFESNVPGIYVAGELGGVGLIKNALKLLNYRTRFSGRGGISVSPEQASHDRAGGIADHRQSSLSQYLEGAIT